MTAIASPHRLALQAWTKRVFWTASQPHSASSRPGFETLKLSTLPRRTIRRSFASSTPRPGSQEDGHQLDHATNRPSFSLLNDHASSKACNPSNEVDPAVDQVGPTASSYSISQDILEKARADSREGQGPFWSHSLYTSPDGSSVRIHYCTSKAAAESVAQSFLGDAVVGFDMEWESGAQPGRNTLKDNVSVVQIAAMDRVAIFHLAMFRGNAAADLMPDSLRVLLERASVVKAGVNIAGDFTRLRRCFDIQGQGLFELSHLYKLVRYSQHEPERINRMPASLSEQICHVFGLPLDKGDVRMSAWASKLSNEQINYAVSDAYAGLHLFDELERRRKALDPRPPRPELYELGKPILLANGLPPPRRPNRGRTAAPGLAVIASVEHIGATDTGPGGSAADDVGHGSEEARLHDAQDEDASKAVPDPRVIAADDWVQARLATPAAEHAVKPSMVKATTLRAYALWHRHNLEPNEVAHALRTPPLKVSTVSTYIAEAIVSDNTLPFDHDRLRLVFVSLPGFIALRYKKLARLLGLTGK